MMIDASHNYMMVAHSTMRGILPGSDNETPYYCVEALAYLLTNRGDNVD